MSGLHIIATRYHDRRDADTIAHRCTVSWCYERRRACMAHTDTSEVIRAAVWLKPAGEALERINKVIRALHKEHGGPQVTPHVTLLTGAETTRASAELKLKHLASR